MRARTQAANQLHALDGPPPRAILLDLCLPQVGGFRLLEVLRQLPALRLYWGRVPKGFTDQRIARARRLVARLGGLRAAGPAGGSLELADPPRGAPRGVSSAAALPCGPGDAWKFGGAGGRRDGWRRRAARPWQGRWRW